MVLHLLLREIGNIGIDVLRNAGLNQILHHRILRYIEVLSAEHVQAQQVLPGHLRGVTWVDHNILEIGGSRSFRFLGLVDIYLLLLISLRLVPNDVLFLLHRFSNFPLNVIELQREGDMRPKEYGVVDPLGPDYYLPV